MNLSQRRYAFLRRLALLCTVLVLLVTSLSAFIRLSQAGLGCDDWPQCYGSRLRDLQQGRVAPEETSSAIRAARLVHRVLASTALLLVITMLVVCFAHRPWLLREGALALALLVLALALAVLGRWTSGARVPAVAMGNLLGGMLMLALCWRLVVGAGDTAASPIPPLGAWALVAALILCCQIALGALTSASFAGLSCAATMDCVHHARATDLQWRMLDPWREPVVEATSSLPFNRAGALTQLLHRAGAMLTLLVLVPLAIAALRGPRRRDGIALLALLGLQLLVAGLMVAAALPLPVALAHNLIAALLLVLVLRMI